MMLIAALLLAGVAADAGWRPYSNVRYGYSSCYPSRLLSPQRSADAGDGRVFRGRDGAELRVYGLYASPTGATVASEVTELSRDLIGQSGKITYKVDRPGWSVISGRIGQSIFWAKVSQRDDRIVVVSFTHPSGKLTIYKKVPQRLNACSTIGAAPF